MSPLLAWEGPAGEMPDFCPNGCGGVTEDPYGGPCQACWDTVPRHGDEYRQSTTACCPRQTIPDSCECPDGCECLCRDCDCPAGEDDEDDDDAWAEQAWKNADGQP